MDISLTMNFFLANMAEKTASAIMLLVILLSVRGSCYIDWQIEKI